MSWGRRSSLRTTASFCWGWFQPGQTLDGADELEMAPAWSPTAFQPVVGTKSPASWL